MAAAPQNTVVDRPFPHALIQILHCMNSSLLDLEPRMKSVFGLAKRFDAKTVQGLAKMAMLVHSKHILSMIDNAIGLIGPDHEMLTELLKSTGKRHAQRGVKIQFIPYMSKAVITALKTIMGDQWSDKLEDAWEIVMDELCEDVIVSIVDYQRAEEQDKSSESNDAKKATTASKQSRRCSQASASSAGTARSARSMCTLSSMDTLSTRRMSNCSSSMGSVISDYPNR